MQLQKQLSSVLERLPVSSASQPTKFIPLDSLFSPDDLQTGENFMQGLEMEDMQTLGFQVMDSRDVAVQRDNRVHEVYQNHAGNDVTSKDVMIETDSNFFDAKKDQTENKPAEQSQFDKKSKAPSVEINLVFGKGAMMSMQLQDMDAKFYEYREQQMAVSVNMSPEQVQKMQLQKLYKIAITMQEVRVKDTMKNLLRNDSLKQGNQELVEQFIKQTGQAGLISLTDVQIEMMFQNWAPDLNEIPLSLRENVSYLCRPSTFQMHKKVIDFDDKEQQMYLIIEGSAVLFQNKYSYNKFQKSLEQAKVFKKQKAVLLQKPNFSNIARVGTILLKFVQAQPIIQQFIERGKRRLEAERIEERLAEGGEVGFSRMGPGSTFGDFSEAKGRTHKPQCVVVMSDTLKCLTIRTKDLKALFEKSLTHENMALIRGEISQVLLSKNVLKKVARGFTEKIYPPGKFILTEGQPLRSIFVLKSGTCEVFSSEHPLKRVTSNHNSQFFKKMPVTGEELCLGLAQGSMSSAFNYFPIKTLGEGSWIGAQSYFNGHQECYFSVKCTSPVSVLEIGVEDFATKMPAEKMKELQQVSIMKQYLWIMRMRDIAVTAKDVKTKEDLNSFHDAALNSLLRLHPHASKRIMNSLSNQQQLEGFVRTARYKDAINVGQIRQVHMPTTGRPTSSMTQSLDNAQDNSNNDEVIKQLLVEKQTRVQALSPTGKQLAQELESRQNLIDRKMEAIEEAKQIARPKYMRNAQAASATQSYEEFLMSEEQKRIDEDLSQRKKRNLMALGVSQNNVQMLSLTTINGKPIKLSPTGQLNHSHDYNEPQLAFQPSEVQLKEMDSLIANRAKHPIKEMRLQAYLKERKNKSARRSPAQQAATSSGASSKQVIRGITFFNAEQAQLERKIDQNERKQVFKLLSSVETAVYQPDPSLIMSQQLLPSLNDQLMEVDRTKMYLEESVTMTESSHRIATVGQYNKMSPFAMPGSQTTKSLRGAAVSVNDSKKQPLILRTNASNSPARSIGRSIGLRNGTSQQSGSAQKTSMRQSCLYHSHKLSKVEISQQHQLKQELRHQLTKSLNFTPGSFKRMKNDTHDTQFSQHTNSLQKMMNQDSSVLGIEPTALFEQEDESIQRCNDSQAMQDQPNAPHNAQHNMLVIETETQQQRVQGRRKSYLSTENSPTTISCGFRLGPSSIGNKQRPSLVQQEASADFVDQPELKHIRPPPLALNYKKIDEQNRASSLLEMEMLKDIKEIVPELGDERLSFVVLDKKPAAETSYDAIKHQLKSQTMETRYLEPNKNLRMSQQMPNNQQQKQGPNILYVQRSAEEDSVGQDTQLSSAGQNAFDEYLQQVQLSDAGATAAFRNNVMATMNGTLLTDAASSVSQMAPTTDESASDGEVITSENEQDETGELLHASSRGASVLKEIERAEQSFGFANQNEYEDRMLLEQFKKSQPVPFVVQGKDPRAWTQTNIAVLHEILSNRKKQMFMPQVQSPTSIKTFKSGMFKVKNLQTIDTVTSSHQSTAHRLINVRDLSPNGTLPPIKHSSLKSPHNGPSTQSQLRVSLPAPNLRYSQRISDYQFDEQQQISLADKMSSSLEAMNSRGLTISQVNLERKPLGKITTRTHASLRQPFHSHDQSSQLLETANNLQQVDGEEIRSPSRFEKVQHKFATIATKSSHNTAQLVRVLQQKLASQSTSGRNSVRQSSLSKSNSIPDDLQNVMNASDINFKKSTLQQSKIFGIKSGAYQQQQQQQPPVRTNKWRSPTDIRGFPDDKPKHYKLNVQKIMRNTLQVNDSSQLFPSITLEQEPSPSGTAVKRDKEKNLTAEASYYRRSLNENPNTNETTESDGTRSPQGGPDTVAHDDSKATLPPENTMKTIPTEDDLLLNSRDTYLNRDGSMERQFATLDTSQLQSVTRIKIAIEKAVPKKDRVTPRLGTHVKTDTSYRYQQKRFRQGNVSSGLKKWVQTRAKELGERSRSPEYLEKIDLHVMSGQSSPATIRSRKKSNPRLLNSNIDLKLESIKVHLSDGIVKENDQQNLRPSELSSINKSSMPPYGQQSLQTLPQEHLINKPVQIEEGTRYNRPVVSQEGMNTMPSQHKPVTGKSEYAPRYKHMPVLIYNKAKFSSNKMILPGAASIETPIEQRNLYRAHKKKMGGKGNILGNSFNTAAAIRESSQFNQQVRQGQAAAVLEQYHQQQAMFEMLPVLGGGEGSLSNVLHRPSQQILDYASQQSMNSSKQLLHSLQHLSYAEINESPSHCASLLQLSNVAVANRAEMTRAKFQRIKEDKMNLQKK